MFHLLREHQNKGGNLPLIVTHDRGFIPDEDLVTELEDGRGTMSRPLP